LEKPIPDPKVASKVHNYDERFVQRYHQVLDGITYAVVEEHMNSKWMVDNDVIEVYKRLNTTMKTLSSGIYYESLPESPVRLSLYRRLKALLDELMQPDPAGARITLKVSEAIDVLGFLTLVAEANCSVRPKGRRYLDWLAERFSGLSQTPQSSGIILP